MKGAYRLKQARRAIQRIAYKMFDIESYLDEEELDRLEREMGFPGQWEEHRRFQMAFLKERGVLPSHRFLEIGFGPLTLGLPLIEYLDAGNYTGVDVRRHIGDVAFQQVAKHNLAWKHPRFIISDDFASTELSGETFDAIHSFSVLFHLHDAQVEKLLSLVAERLRPSGRYWANINAEMPESTWLEFPFMARQPEFYEAIAARNGLKMTVLGRLEDLDFRLPNLERDNLLLEFTQQTSA